MLIIEIYNKFSKAVLHGGTALWRCYGSNRFSEDLDFYLPKNVKEKDFKDFLNNLRQKGFIIEKFKITSNLIFFKFSFLNVTVSFEAVFKNIKNFETRSFEMSDGSFILVNTLGPEDLLEEKLLTYLERKRVRDLYDIFFLIKIVEKNKVKRDVIKLMKNIEKPIDEKELKVLIISGSIPTTNEMIETIKKWAR